MPRQAEKPGATYSKASIGLHWFMLLLLAVVYALIELREFYPRGSEPREALKTWHFTAGLLVFGLVWMRIVVRLLTSRFSRPASPGDWLAGTVHLALYGLMVLIPIVGWMVLSASGKPIPFFGIELPALVPVNKAAAGQLKEVHEVAGVVGYWLVGLHAAAALLHHYVLKDATLRRMLPARRPA